MRNPSRDAGTYARPRWRARYRVQDVRQFNKDATTISTMGLDINVGPHS